MCPHSGIAPWAAAKGRPWPSAATSASMPRCPLRNACVRPAWLTGRPRSTSTARRPSSRPGSWRDRVSPVGAKLAREEAGKPSIHVTEPALSRSGSHTGFWSFIRSVSTAGPCGSKALLPQVLLKQVWLVYDRESQVGCQAASRASFAPTGPAQTSLVGVRPGEPGRLSGRLASKLCSHRSCSNKSGWSTTGRARSAVRPPREQALLPQVLLKQVWWCTTGEPGRLLDRLASKLCSHRSCSNRSDGCTTGRARSAVRPPRGGR